MSGLKEVFKNPSKFRMSYLVILLFCKYLLTFVSSFYLFGEFI